MEKIKQFIKHCFESEKGKDVLVVIVVILVGFGSFELGRLSIDNSPGGIKILPVEVGVNSSQEVMGQNGNVFSAATDNTSRAVFSTGAGGEKSFFASNRGSKYYTLGCSAGKTIKQENRIYFTTGEEAQAAGYTLSSLCN